MYTHENIKELIEYAGVFGIRLIPEVNMPGNYRVNGGYNKIKDILRGGLREIL